MNRLLTRHSQPRGAARTLAAALAVAFTAQPMVPVLSVSIGTATLGFSPALRGDALIEAAADGQALGESLLHGPVTDGEAVFFDGASGVESVRIEEIFQGSGSADDVEAMTEAFGSEAAATRLAKDVTERLADEDSAQGMAFRTIRGSALGRSHPDLVNDPSLARSREVLDGDDPVFATFFTGCDAVSVPATGGGSVHLPNLEYCDRIVTPVEQCELLHEYDAGVVRLIGGEGGLTGCGPGCVDLFVGRVGNNYWTGNCQIFEQTALVDVPNPDAIVSATLQQAVWDDYLQIYLGDALVWQGPNANFPPETPGPCELTTSWDERLSVDLTHAFRNNTSLQFRIRVSVTGGGEGYARIRLHYDKDALITQDVWRITPECQSLLDGIRDGACTVSSLDCIDGPPHSTDCIEIDGHEICQRDLSAAPVPGYSPLCHRGTVDADCAFFERAFPCWIDVSGTKHCPTLDQEVAEECRQYETNPNCAFLESACIEGAQGESGSCYAFTETWDCGYDVAVPRGETTTMACGGPIRCMGEDCVSHPRETNPDFTQAATVLAGINFTAMDRVCADDNPASCELFSGEAMECKRALGGLVDCCGTPEGVSLADYLKLSLASFDLARKLKLGERLAAAGIDAPGAWTSMRDFGGATLGRITKPVTSAWGSLTQSYGGASLEAIEGFSLGQLRATATSAIGEFVAGTFGPEVASLFFEPTLDAGGEVIGWTLNGPVSTALSAIMWAYTVYTIVNVLAQIIWECEEEEFILGARRELRSCQRVGAYCADRLLVGCVERRDAYCCYNSPFARLAQQAIRPQLGLTFGAPDAPTCDGFSVAQLAAVDWGAINWDEWYAILATNGVIPNTLQAFDAAYSMEKATTNERSRTPPPSGAERIEQRLDAADIEAAREKVRRELWNGVGRWVP